MKTRVTPPGNNRTLKTMNRHWPDEDKMLMIKDEEKA
jgi:hypothetical protein